MAGHARGSDEAGGAHRTSGAAWQAWAVGLVLALVVLAGCSDGPRRDGQGPPPPPPPPYQLDCTLASANAGNWSDGCTRHASPNASPTKAEVDVAVNPADPRNLFTASKDMDPLASDCVWSVGQASKDGGRTWNTTYVGGTAQARSSPLLEGWQCVTDPIMAFGADGTLYYPMQMYQLAPRTLPDLPVNSAGLQVLAVSQDGGASFGEFILLDQSDQLVTFDDYMRMDVSPTTGTVFVVWQQLTGVVTQAGALGRSIAEVSAYEPGASTARPPLLIAGSATTAQASSIVVDGSGRVYAWMGGINGPPVASFFVSTDDGLTFGTAQRAFEFERMEMGSVAGAQYRANTFVELAVDRTGGVRDGCLYAMWAGQDSTEAGGAQGPADVLVRTSCDQGATWTEPVRVHQRSERAQFFPRMAVDGNGTLHAVYYTQAYGGGTALDAEWAYSMDGGVNWTAERVTTQSFDGNLGLHQDGFPFIGDYIGIAAHGGDVWMAFPHTGTGVAEIAVAHALRTP